MKKTLNVNIGSVAFTMDEDAYHTINGYYDDIRSRLCDADRQEIMDDIESRTADIFRENLSFPLQVVNIDIVKKTIAIIGSASTFGEKRYDSEYVPPYEKRGNPKKLYRSWRHSILGGVCGGLADYFNSDVLLIRILMLLFIFITGGVGFVIYFVLWIVIPTEPVRSDYFNRKFNRRESR